MYSQVTATHDYGPKRFKWLTLKLIQWKDPTGKLRWWESAERTTRSSAGVDGVAVVAKLKSQNCPPQIVLVSQYRPPIDSICVELPAGLIDQGEDAAAAALRELKEETGLVAEKIISVTPMCYADPGMTNANMQVVVVEVDLDAECNKNAQQRLDPGEFIEFHYAPFDGLLAWLLNTKIESGWEIDSRLMSFAMGLELGRKDGSVDPQNGKNGGPDADGIAENTFQLT